MNEITDASTKTIFLFALFTAAEWNILYSFSIQMFATNKIVNKIK